MCLWGPLLTSAHDASHLHDGSVLNPIKLQNPLMLWCIAVCCCSMSPLHLALLLAVKSARCLMLRIAGLWVHDFYRRTWL